ncbi:Arc family DNA-binding protein, partial [Pontibacterium sp.]|uniref:Arc family DNA-binding protein n=1 Tax=Pontibacterium sp. TaxID=2036026 RepID=UPI00356ABFC3
MNSIRVTLRIPEDIHEQLTASADQASRSMNGEIIERLKESFREKDLLDAIGADPEIAGVLRQHGESLERQLVEVKEEKE